MNFRILILLALFPLFSHCQNSLKYVDQWPQFRGPYARGTVTSENLPDTWDLGIDENLKWKTEIPGLGLSSPVVWGNKIFITTAISGSGTDSLKVGLYGDIDAVDDVVEHEFRTICVNKNTGVIE